MAPTLAYGQTVDDLSMRSRARAGAAKDRAEAHDKTAAELDARAAKARGKLDAAKQRLAKAEAAVAAARTALAVDFAAGDDRTAGLEREAAAHDARAVAWSELARVWSVRAGGDTAAAVAQARDMAAARSDAIGVAALYSLALFRFHAGDVYGGRTALADDRVTSEYRGAKKIASYASTALESSSDRSASRARSKLSSYVSSELSSMPRRISDEERRARRDQESALAKRDKILAGNKKSAAERLVAARKAVADAEKVLADAGGLIPTELAEAGDEVASLRKDAAAARAEASRYDAIAAALQAYSDGDWAKAAALATEAAAASKGDMKVGAQFLAGVSHYRAGAFAQAAAALDDRGVAKAYPQSRRMRAFALAKAGDEKAAVAAFAKAGIADSDAEALTVWAPLALEVGDRKAAQVARRALAANPGDRTLVIAVARAELKSGKADAGIALLERALVLDPTDKALAYELGYLYLKSGRRADAERALRHYAGAATPGAVPARDVARSRSGHSLYVVPVPSQPVSLAATPDADASRMQVAAMLADRGDLLGARAELGAIAKPTSAVWYARGVVAFQLGRFEEAYAAFGSAKSPLGAHGQGAVALRRGETKVAKSHFDSGSGALAAIGAGVAIAMTDPKAGAAALETSKRDKTWGKHARLNRAVALYHAGDFAASRKALGKVGDTTPNAPEAHVLAAHLALEAGDTPAAIAALDQAVSLAPAYHDAWRLMGVAAVAAGDGPRGVKALTHVLDGDPKDIDARALLAKAYQAAGDQAAADRELERVAAARQAARDKLTEDARAGAIGVATFENTSKSEDHAWLQQGIPEAVATDLAKAGLKVVERTQIMKAAEEQKLGELGLVEEESAPKVGKMIGAQTMVVGAYQIQGESIRMSARLIDVSSGRVLQVADATGPIDQVLTLERQLAMELVTDYYAIDKETQKRVYGSSKPSQEALQEVAAARTLALKGNAAAARQRFKKAMESDPAFAREVAKVSKEWSGVAATVACLPLANISGDDKHGWYSRGIASSLCGDLHRIGIFVVERLAVDKVFEERKFTELFSPDEAANTGKQLGASMVVVGGYQVQNGKIQIDVRFVDVETSQVLLSERMVGNEDDLFDLEAKLAEKIAKILDTPVTAEQVAAISAENPTIGEFRRYMQSRSKVAVGGEQKTVNLEIVAVGTFDNASGRAEDSAYGGQLATSVQRSLSTSKKLKLVDRQAILDAAAAGKDPLAEGLTLGAQGIVIGAYEVIGDRIRIEARVVSTATGEVLVSVKAEGEVAKMAAVEAELGNGLLTALGLSSMSPITKVAKASDPFYTEWWFWGGAVGAVAVGTVAGMILVSDSDPLPAGDVSVSCSNGMCD